jgi:IS4 transposase
MNQGRMTFSQLMDFASQDIFKACVKRYNGNYKAKDFTCWKQFLCLAFGQLTHRESLSDTMLCLELNADKLYRLGIGKAVHKSTVSRANENRDWRIFQDFGLKLIEQARVLYEGDNQLNVRLKGRIFALDSTTIDLCLEVFWWATFRTTKAAIKMHTLLDLKTSIPEYIYISEGDVHDVNALDQISIQKGSYYVMDKAYVDFARLYRIKQDKAYFVIRAKENMQFERVVSRPADKEAGIICDQDIQLTGLQTCPKYPDLLRRIRFYDVEFDRTFVFLTNNFKLKATTVTQLYKHRWQIELFFKWIKQHLKIKTFWGQTENAVRTQIWVAVSVYIIVAIAKKKLKLQHSLYEILQYVSLSPFERTPITKIFLNNEFQEIKEQNDIQLKIKL